MSRELWEYSFPVYGENIAYQAEEIKRIVVPVLYAALISYASAKHKAEETATLPMQYRYTLNGKSRNTVPQPGVLIAPRKEA